MVQVPAQVRFLPGSSFDIDFLADLYTQTFADYFYPCLVTPEDLSEYVRIEQLDLARSPVMLVDEKPVGFATVGIRGTASYCKGFGVIVPYRGRGLSHVLCGEMVRQARAAGAQRMTLGVIKQNTRAVQAYRSAGFLPRRELVSIEWRADTDDRGERGGEAVVEASAAELLDRFGELHAVQPIWNRDLPSLKEIRGVRGLAVMEDGVPSAHVLIREGGGAMEIVDLGARGGERGAASFAGLLVHLQRSHHRLTCVNEPADNPLLATLLATCFRETVRRLELELTL